MKKTAVTLFVEYKDHDKVILSNTNGDTFSSKSEDLMDFLHRTPRSQASELPSEMPEWFTFRGHTIDKELWNEIVKRFSSPTKKELVSVEELESEISRLRVIDLYTSKDIAQHIVDTYLLNPPKREWWMDCEKFKVGATIMVSDGYRVDRFNNSFLICDENIYPVVVCTPYIEPTIFDKLKAKGVTDDEINELINQHEKQEFI